MKYLAIVPFLFSFPLVAEPTVTIKGSDTMVILNQRWAERYMDNRAGVVVQVTGGQSRGGPDRGALKRLHRYLCFFPPHERKKSARL